MLYLLFLWTGDSGRVLYEKNGETPLANASTTKVLTCIVALESAPGDDYVQVSQNAVSQSEVKLGLQKGDSIIWEDLLYSLCLRVIMILQLQLQSTAAAQWKALPEC